MPVSVAKKNVPTGIVLAVGRAEASPESRLGTTSRASAKACMSAATSGVSVSSGYGHD
jgi:hypothetical protein